MWLGQQGNTALQHISQRSRQLHDLPLVQKCSESLSDVYQRKILKISIFQTDLGMWCIFMLEHRERHISKFELNWKDNTDVTFGFSDCHIRLVWNTSQCVLKSI